MSYPKQTGYIPPYSGPAPISINSEPENLDEAVKRGHTQKIHYFIKNNPEQINHQGFHGQTPLHMICMRADDILAQVPILGRVTVKMVKHNVIEMKHSYSDNLISPTI